MTDQENGKRFFSLKLKWALGTSIGSFIIFSIVVMAMFSAFTQNLLGSERRLLNNGMDNISRQLSNTGQVLTKHRISDIINPPSQADFNEGEDFKRPIIQELSDNHLIVNIYTPKHQLVFTTGKRLVKPTFSDQRSVKMTEGPKHKIIAGLTPIYSRHNRHLLIGYLQVENDLNAYMASYHQIQLVCFFAMCLVILASGLLGYFLSMFLLRPLGDIHDTVKAISKDPTKNIRVPKVDRCDELAELTDMFNEMLDRMQRYIDQQT